MDRLAVRLFQQPKTIVAMAMLMCADILALLVASVFSLYLRFDEPFIYTIQHHFSLHLLSLPFIIGLYLIIFASFRLYRYAWRFASLDAVWGVIAANSIGVIGLIVLQRLIDGQTFPMKAILFFWLLSIVLVGGLRIILRLINLSRNFGRDTLRAIKGDTDIAPRRVVILGGGNHGAHLLAALHEDPRLNYDIIGILDDRPQKHGIYIRGICVLGPLNHLHNLLAAQKVDEVLIAGRDINGARLREYVMACRKKQISVKVVPDMDELLSGKSVPHFEEISVEDLLRRPPVNIDLAGIGYYLTDKRVLVTGAGGSIGSEACRQILALDPSELILLGHGENSIHRIKQELSLNYPHLAARVHAVIGSVADDVRMDQVVQSFHPQVILHAAAHKHVPIMEENVPEAVQNNVMGTYCIAHAAGRAGVERMVLISTDKAVYPSSVMGATKWLCEQVVRQATVLYPKTSFVTVRFGNVLGSRGSVIPIFQEQIRRGGPVTVTHPEMTRYFMTIPEAVQLVLQAGAIGQSGELYLLNMGEPVKIVDMTRDMIRLNGLEPDIDIPILFTGLRQGEKLHEMLSAEDEDIRPASCEGMHVVTRPLYFSVAELRDVVRRLQHHASSGDTGELLDLLRTIVPRFTPAHSTLASATASSTQEKTETITTV